MGGLTEENEEALRARARKRIEQGLLPREKPLRMWGGRGTGAACTLCDHPIETTEPEMELEYEPPTALPCVRFHLRCQSIWELARERQMPSQWISMAAEMPPLRMLVEARIGLGESRSLILNVMRVNNGETGPVVWLNATTNSQLPDSWIPFEWRLPAEAVSAVATSVVPPLSRRA
jgi:hypothetical protein